MRFLGFVYSTCLLALFNLGCCLAHIGMLAGIVESNGNSMEMLESAGSSIFIGFYILMFLVFIGGLAGFHTYLIIKGYTTNEVMKKSFNSRKMHPYQRSNCFKHLINYWKQTKTQWVQFDKEITVGSKEYCFTAHSVNAMHKSNVVTEFDGVGQERNEDKASISETPSIIHDNFKTL